MIPIRQVISPWGPERRTLWVCSTMAKETIDIKAPQDHWVLAAAFPMEMAEMAAIWGFSWMSAGAAMTMPRKAAETALSGFKEIWRCFWMNDAVNYKRSVETNRCVGPDILVLLADYVDVI